MEKNAAPGNLLFFAPRLIQLAIHCVFQSTHGIGGTGFQIPKFSPHGNSLHISTMLRSLPDTSPFGKVPGPLVKVVVFVEPLLDPYP